MVYKLEVANKVAKDWAFANHGNTSNNKNEALILLAIDRQGQIMDIAIVIEPGSKSLKASVLKAIMQSEPFPAFPENFNDDQIEVGIKAVPKAIECGSLYDFSRAWIF